MSVENELKHINHQLEVHEVKDDTRFTEMLTKQDVNHDIHIRNEEILKQILEQTKKTNGRIAKLEEEVVDLKKCNALLSQIVSQQHDQYQNFVTQYEKMKGVDADNFVSKDQFAPVKGFVYGLVTLILTAVGVAIVAVVIK
jgi:exoribonuclease R